MTLVSAWATAPSAMVIEPFTASTSIVPAPPVCRSPAADWVRLLFAMMLRLPDPELTVALRTTSLSFAPVERVSMRTLPLPIALIA